MKGQLPTMGIGMRQTTEDAETPDTSNSRKPLSPIIAERTQCYKRPLNVRASTEGRLDKSYYSRGHSQCQLSDSEEGGREEEIPGLPLLIPSDLLPESQIGQIQPELARELK